MHNVAEGKRLHKRLQWSVDGNLSPPLPRKLKDLLFTFVGDECKIELSWHDGLMDRFLSLPFFFFFPPSFDGFIV